MERSSLHFPTRIRSLRVSLIFLLRFAKAGLPWTRITYYTQYRSQAGEGVLGTNNEPGYVPGFFGFRSGGICPHVANIGPSGSSIY